MSPRVGLSALLVGPRLTAAPAGFNVPAVHLYTHTDRKNTQIPCHRLIIITHAHADLNSHP